MIIITQKITGVSVVKDEPPIIAAPTPPALLNRANALEGKTYKIKTPMSEHALYVTINNILDNGIKKPFEIFINSKNMENFAWIVAFTRVISAVFRHGGDATFLVEEMKSVFDPKGGYFKPGGKFMPSLVAEIGHVLESHLIGIGAMQPIDIPPELQAKRESAKGTAGTLCPQCGQMAVARLDGCDTCLDCGYSKCG